MITKVLGYVLSVMGLLGLLLTFDKVKELTKVAFLESITKTQITIVAIVLIAIGVFLIFKSKSSSTGSKEVPIYHGDQVVGYRRHSA